MSRHSLFTVGFLVFSLSLLSGLSGCMTGYKKSVGGEKDRIFTRIFLTDFDTGWQATLSALKSNPLEISNREAGFVRTKWVDNTAARNFVDSFAAANAYLEARYRFRVILTKGFYNGQTSTKVSVQKEQVVKRDVLEGWSPIPSDSIDENTLLYRIGRLIVIRMKLARIEEERTQRALEEAEIE